MSFMPSIEQFRHVVSEIRQYVEFDQKYMGGGLMQDIQYPVITASGTVKIHGTNASVKYDGSNLIVQSRNKVITPDNDNCGFAAYVESNRDKFIELMEYTYKAQKQFYYKVSSVTVFGEWAGKGIQKGTAINSLDKKWYVFLIKIDTNYRPIWKSWDVSNISHYDVLIPLYDIVHWIVKLDFNDPAKTLAELNEILAEVENECPIAKHYGVSGVGEGLVFSFAWEGKDYRFKLKGSKFVEKQSEKKHITKPDSEKIVNLAANVVPIWRLEQMYNELFDIDNGGKGDIHKTKDYIKAVVADVHKEEYDLIQNLAKDEAKLLGKYIGKAAVSFLMECLDKESGI
jgi:hypothetical protein